MSEPFLDDSVWRLPGKSSNLQGIAVSQGEFVIHLMFPGQCVQSPIEESFQLQCGVPLQGSVVFFIKNVEDLLLVGGSVQDHS